MGFHHILEMDGETSWVMNDTGRNIAEFKSFSEIIDEGDKNSIVSLDFILPDDLLERILGYLPVVSIVRAGSVCKRWKEVVNSRRFLWNSSFLAQKPWYFMFTSGGVDPGGYVYDPIFRKWYGFVLPCIETSDWFIASSGGLVCFMDGYSRRLIYACNPITRDWKMIEEPPGFNSPDYSALAVSFDRKLHGYTVAVAKSKQVPDDFLRWDLSIHIYDSETKQWTTPISEVLTGWRGGDESVICNGTLYCLIYSTGVVGGSENRHGLIMYDLSTRSCVSLMATLIPVPCPLTCGRLMNLNDRLVMVGGIGKLDRPDIIKGIGIWELHKKDWQEVSKMPHKYFQGFGEFDDVFASSGTDNLIYIQSYGAPALLIFDMSHKQWKWSQKCPVAKKFPLQLFTGFCFEPRLEIAP